MRIKEPVAAIGDLGSSGIQAVKEGVKGAVEAVLETIRPETIIERTTGTAESIIGTLAKTGTKVAEAVSGTTAQAVENLKNTAREYGVRLQDVISQPYKYVERHINSAVDAERNIARKPATANIQGPQAQIWREIEQIKDPKLRREVTQAYYNQLSKQKWRDK